MTNEQKQKLDILGDEMARVNKEYNRLRAIYDDYERNLSDIGSALIMEQYKSQAIIERMRKIALSECLDHDIVTNRFYPRWWGEEKMLPQEYLDSLPS